MRWKTIGAGLLVVVGIGAAAFAVIGPSIGGTTATQYLTSQATVTDVLDQVAATGTVGAATTYTLAFGSAPTVATSSTSTSSSSTGATTGGGTSWTVTSVDVAAGQVVAAGDVLATADASSAALDVAVAEANLASAQARLASDRKGLTAAEKASARLQVTQASQSLSQARSSYSSTVAQNNLKLRQAQADVTRTHAAYAKAKAGRQPRASIDQARSAWIQATSSLASLKLQVSQSNTQAANQISQASLSVQSAKYAYQQKTAKADAATIATDKAAVAQAQQAVTTAKAALRYTSLVSPVAGVVVAVNVTHRARRPVRGRHHGPLERPPGHGLGDRVGPPEHRPGAGRDGHDHGARGGSHGQGRAHRPDARGLELRRRQLRDRLSLPGAPAGTVPGMSAEIAITTASASDVLAVPAIALTTTTDGSYTVRVLDASGQPTSVVVEVGLITSSLAEIKGGISEGTAVVTGTASDRTSSSSSTTTTRLPGIDGGIGIPGGGFPGRQP